MAKISESTGINSVQLKEQSSAPDTPSSGYAQLFVKADGLYLKDDAGNVIGPLVKREDYILIQDQKTAGTSGGTFTSGDWRTRDLNTEVTDTGGHASIASNQITLVAGTYQCKIYAPAFTVGDHQARLQDITNNTTLLYGTCAFSNQAGYSDVTNSIIAGRFTLTGNTTLEVQHKCYQTQNTNGFGVSFGATESAIYTTAEFWRES